MGKTLVRFGLWGSCCLSVLIASCTDAQNAAQVEAPEPTPMATVTASAPPAATPARSPQTKATPLTEADLWTKLQQADQETYAVLLRHAIAPGTGDPANFQLDDCSTQRNLSEAGRQQARAIGEAFREGNVPVAQVLSSQWCRCLETAELMDLGPVEPFPPLNSFFSDRSTAATQTAQVQDYLIANQDRPGVIVMVTHQVNITALSDVFPRSGSAVVLQVNENNQLTVLGQLSEPAES